MRTVIAMLTAALMLAGCGTAAAGQQGPATARTATAGTATARTAPAGTAPAGTAPAGTAPAPGPRPGDRAEALAFARHLLTLPVLPPGTRPAGKGQQVPADVPSPASPYARDVVRQSRPLVAPGTPRQVQAYLLAHAPKGADTSWGQMGGPGGPAAWDAEFSLPTLREGLYLADLVAVMAPGAGRTSLVNETAYVIWFPPRSAAENTLNPAAYRSVSIAEIGAARVTRTFPAAVATRLLQFLRGLQAAPDTTPPSCPERSAAFTLTFHPGTRRAPVVRVQSYGCWADQVWIGDVQQPDLSDQTGLYTLTARLLDVKA